MSDKKKDSKPQQQPVKQRPKAAPSEPQTDIRDKNPAKRL